MPRNPTLSVQIAPIKGYITEASPLVFPENAMTNGSNVVLDETGRLKRRKGFEYENDYSTETVGLVSTSVTKEFVWKGAGGNGENNFLVIQFGNTLYFYNLEDEPISANKHATTIDLSTYQTSGATNIQSDSCSFANGDGVLFVVHPQCEPFYVDYSESANSITGTQISILTRDLEGVDDGFEIDERPTTSTDEHDYNLYNQGWYQTVVVNGGSTSVAYDYWDAQRSDFPSNADVWWYYRDADEEFNSGWIDKVSLGNTPAPKGHYLINPFQQDRSSVSSIPNITTVSTSGQRPSTVQFFAGRVWYAGVAEDGWNSTLYFSQVVLSEEDYGKCYQNNDPTSSEIADLLPSDGGTITILDCGTILYLHNVQNYLLVFGTNGVWSITGSEGTGFKANDFAVNKISEFSVISSYNIVSVDGLPIWWNTDGIYGVSVDSTIGSLTVQSLTDSTIKSFYATIPNSEKKYVKGIFNPLTKVISWLYRSSASSNIRQRFQYDRVLNFNYLLKAFYPPWTISQPIDGPIIAGIFETSANNATDTSTFFLTLIEASTDNYTITVSKEHDTDYLDWTTFDATGTNYSSTATMGYTIAGQNFLRFASNYIVVITDTVTNSEAYIRGIWDYANDEDSGKYSVAQNIYPNRPYFGIQQKRLKLRGSGRSLQIKIESAQGKPFCLIGWTILVLVNQGP